MTGKPGKDYWQSRGDYNIQVNFNPATSLLKGDEVITYFNNSPDSLKEIIIRLYPDLYKKGIHRESHVDQKDLTDGVSIDSFEVGGETISNFSNEAKAFHSGTNLIIKPADIILPHSKTKFHVQWHYTVNTGSPVRTGMVDSASYFIAYFFPRISVYDDIDGWDTWSYNGTQEFYNDFGKFNVEISVPKNYVVWATGKCLNSSENFSDNILQKLNQATTSDAIIHVIDSTDYAGNKVFSNTTTGVWKFSADSVTDFCVCIERSLLLGCKFCIS